MKTIKGRLLLEGVVACVIVLIALVYGGDWYATSGDFNLLLIGLFFIFMCLYIIDTFTGWKRNGIIWKTLSISLCLFWCVLLLGVIQHYEIVFMLGQKY